MTSIYGVNLLWNQPTVTYRLEFSERDKSILAVEKSLIEQHIAWAVDSWTSFSCFPYDIKKAEQDLKADVSIRFEHDEWHHNKTMVAYTHVNSEGKAAIEGLIQSVQMEFNGAQMFSFTEETTDTAVDFQTILLHELGHALGLAHVVDKTQVMDLGVKLGLKKRELTEADKTALCDAYRQRLKNSTE